MNSTELRIVMRVAMTTAPCCKTDTVNAIENHMKNGCRYEYSEDGYDCRSGWLCSPIQRAAIDKGFALGIQAAGCVVNPGKTEKDKSDQHHVYQVQDADGCGHQEGIDDHEHHRATMDADVEDMDDGGVGVVHQHPE